MNTLPPPQPGLVVCMQLELKHLESVRNKINPKNRTDGRV